MVINCCMKGKVEKSKVIKNQQFVIVIKLSFMVIK